MRRLRQTLQAFWFMSIEYDSLNDYLETTKFAILRGLEAQPARLMAIRYH